MPVDKRIVALTATVILIAGIISQSVIANTPTEAYTKRVEQLLKLDNIYLNKDGKVGGEFKLSDDSTARIYGVSEDGTVYVTYQGNVRPFSNKEMDRFILQNQN